MERELTPEQEQAFGRLLKYIQELGESYVGKDLKWFTIEEISVVPYYQIRYNQKGYLCVEFHTHENGYQQFVLRIHDELCEKKIITEESNHHFFSKELLIGTVVMECLNEMYKLKNSSIKCYLSIRDDGSELQNFRKNFIA